MASSDHSGDVEQETLVTHTGSSLPAHSPAREPRRGELLGRYVVLEKVGQGGMGAVYLAYDPELDRRVAIKLMKARQSSRGTQGPSRLLREAQAMARLSHPNVISVFDVGTLDGQVFVAMEYAPGGTLREKLEGPQRPSVSEVLELMISAGRGLAAAHAAGLIHRDFKPENVLLDDAGRIRVADFGLARAAGPSTGSEASALGPALSDVGFESDSGEEESEDGTVTSQASLEIRMTMTGAALGTPAYMAPEQHRGGDVGPAADQFAFCVALYEGLYGQRPFGGDSVAAVYFQAMRGQIREPPKDARVPRAVHQAIVRGLSAKPVDRWPDMDGLLTALSHDRLTVRRRALAAGLSVAAALAIGGMWFGSRATDEETMCTGAQAHLAGVWDEDIKGRVSSAFARSERGWAQTAWPRIEAQLDAYAESWVLSHVDACEATRVRGEQSEALMDRRMACLERRKKQIQSTAELLATGEEKVLQRAQSLVGGIEPLYPCSDIASLEGGAPPPREEEREPMERLQEQADQANALVTAGKYQDALALVEGFEHQLDDASHLPTRAAALRAAGVAHSGESHVDEARELLTRGYADALESGDHRLASQIAADLMSLDGADLRFVLEWGRIARASAKRIGGDGGLEIPILLREGNALRKGDRTDEAIDRYEQAREITIRHHGPDDYRVGDVWYNIATVHLMRKELPEARALMERAKARWSGHFGPEHPRTLTAHNGLAVANWREGRFNEALATFEELIEINSRNQGDHSDSVADLHFNMGTVYAQIGRPAEAIVSLKRARGIYVQNHGDDHLFVGQADANLALAYRASGRHDEAVESARNGLRIVSARVGPDHADVATGHGMLGIALASSGELEDALVEQRTSLAILEKSRGQNHPSLLEPLTEIARAQLGLDNLDGARSALDRVRRIGIVGRQDVELDVRYLEGWLQYADARKADPQERGKGRRRVEEALKAYAELPSPRPESLVEMQTWLDEHPAR